MDKVQPLLQRSLVQSAQTDRLPSRLVTLKHHPYLSASSNRDTFFPPSDRQNCQHLSKFENGEPSFAVLCRAFSEA
ncbi:hypothetical protein BgiBS90_009166 [Biomphalaria glabrata]|nr:hypothetical protein BgiBS90_009166 [Biomphalaria glabrata]